jgi:hypothetical protein
MTEKYAAPYLRRNSGPDTMPPCAPIRAMYPVSCSRPHSLHRTSPYVRYVAVPPLLPDSVGVMSVLQVVEYYWRELREVVHDRPEQFLAGVTFALSEHDECRVSDSQASGECCY